MIWQKVPLRVLKQKFEEKKIWAKNLPLVRNAMRTAKEEVDLRGHMLPIRILLQLNCWPRVS